MKFFKDLLGTFNTKDEGHSARKWTAFALMICIGYIHYKYVDRDNAVEVLIIDLCGVLIALGIVTAEQIIKLKNGQAAPEKQE